MRTAGRVLVCFATEHEARPFRRSAAQLASVRILITGIGPDRARATLRAALDREPVDLVLSSGFAGGLAPDLARGTIIFDTEDIEIAWLIESIGGRRARFHTAGRIAVTAADKRALRNSTGADAVEMESGALREFCRERSVPCSIVRVISDTATEDLPLDFNRLSRPDLSLSYCRLGLELLRHPGKIGRLARFGKEMKRCATQQAAALETLLRTPGK